MAEQNQQLLVLSAAEVEQLLSMESCVELMAETLAAFARGEMEMPLRTVMRPSDAAGLMGLMPAYDRGDGAFGVKAICVFSGNPKIGKDAHQGGVLLFSGETGEPLAMINASAITAIRTGAVSGVATRLLARDDANKLTIIGAGVQARSHLRAIACVRKISEARVVSRNVEHAQKLADEMSNLVEFPITAETDVASALRGADIIVTATSSHEPVLQREWISPGAHINAIGTYSPQSREIDTATMAAASLFTDRRESMFKEAGDYLMAANKGAIDESSLKGELGELLIGSKRGRSSDDEITLFKSLGLAVEDLACAKFLFSEAKRSSVGQWVSF